MKKKIFVTGITSTLSQKIVSLINTSEYDIFGLTRNKEKLNLSNVTILEGNLQNIDKHEHIIKESDIIIHAAAITHSYNKKKYFDINYKATENLFSMLNKDKDVKFVFVSSNTANKNNGEYAQSKFLAEESVKKYCNNYLILRPSEIYGYNSNEGIEKLIKNIATKKFLFYPNKLNYKFSPIHISDAANYIYYEIFNNPLNINKTISINGNENYTFGEIYKLGEKIFETKKILIPIPLFIMKFVDKIINTFPFQIGIYPDQIKRLYGEKSTDINLKFNQFNIEDYLLEKKAQQQL